jgi:hypothetical protein
MPKRLTPEDRWETDFEVPIPNDPRRIGPLEVLFQRLLNRTERLKNRLGAILGLPWDATPPDTLAGLAGRVSTLETTAGVMYGSNSNGFYFRFADGTQICWGVNVGAGPDPQTITYPAAFAWPPAVVVTPSDWPAAHISVDSQWGYGTTQQRFRKYYPDGSAYTSTVYSFNYIAIGRWR